MTLSFLGGLFRAKTIRNALVVAPVSVLRSWEKESYKILKTLKCCAAPVRIQVVSSEGMTVLQRSRALRRALEWYVRARVR